MKLFSVLALYFVILCASGMERLTQFLGRAKICIENFDSLKLPNSNQEHLFKHSVFFDESTIQLS